MNVNFDTFIKQEVLNPEENTNTILPFTDLNITVKNEPISDEISPYVTIKNEPLCESMSTNPPTVVKNENQYSNQLTVPGDSFIIYELQTPSSSQPLTAQDLQNNKQIFIATAPQLDPSINVPAFTEQTVITNTNHITPSNLNTITNKIYNKEAVSAPPILLNGQLRKRNKVVLPVSSIDKRKRYNIEGATKAFTKKQNPILDANASSKTLNFGNKKIINHLIKNRQILRKQKTSAVNSENTLQPEITETTNTIKIHEQILSTISLNPNDQTFPMSCKEINLNVSTSPLTIENSLSPIPVPQTETNLSLSSTSLKPDTKEPPYTPELRVKCLCSLTSDNKDISDSSELRLFFKNMFEETRRLNKKQQRKVKMTLLQTISDAEELMEQGKCCGFE